MRLSFGFNLLVLAGHWHIESKWINFKILTITGLGLYGRSLLSIEISTGGFEKSRVNIDFLWLKISRAIRAKKWRLL